MKDITHAPFVGAARSSCRCNKTISVIAAKIRGLSDLQGETMLDVGCGDGSFTLSLSEGFATVFAVDVQQDLINSFQEKVRGDSKFQVQLMSAERLHMADESIDTIITIETIEHIEDIEKAVKEMYRVLRRGGELIITCPNRLFPFENHGMRLFGREFHTRIPLLTYIPPLHRKLSLARVFSVRDLRQLFGSQGFVCEEIDYAWPTFEHGGNPFQPLLRPLFGAMRFMESSPLRLFGSSIVAKFTKPGKISR